jgi:hypothetical protein
MFPLPVPKEARLLVLEEWSVQLLANTSLHSYIPHHELSDPSPNSQFAMVTAMNLSSLWQDK